MPAVARIGDANLTHCSQPFMAQGSPNVRANGIGISRVGDLNTGHLLPGVPICPGHAAAISSGSSTVRINGRACGRVGDPTCTAVSQGSPNVVVGG